MSAELATTTFNKDILMLFQKANRALKEVNLSNSANAAVAYPPDLDRWLLLVNDIRGFIAELEVRKKQGWIPDLVESHPFEMNLPEVHAIVPVQNEAVMHVCFSFQELRIECSNSDSAREHGNLLFYDRDIVLGICDTIEGFVDGYMRKLLPLHRPKSSPSFAMAPPGERGVNP